MSARGTDNNTPLSGDEGADSGEHLQRKKSQPRERKERNGRADSQLSQTADRSGRASKTKNTAEEETTPNK